MNFKFSLIIIEGQHLAHQGRCGPGVDDIRTDINSAVITHCFAIDDAQMHKRQNMRIME